MKILLAGKGKLACQILEYLVKHDHDVEVLPVQPPPSWAPNLIEKCIELEIAYWTDGHYRNVVGEYDMLFSVYYDKIFSKEFLAKFDRAFNLHNAPLPKYRGVNPINWALKNEELQHGVTIHEILPGIDNGKIIAQTIFPIDPDKHEVIDVYNQCLKSGWALFQQVFPMILTIEGVKQDENKATYYSNKDFDKLGDRQSFRRPTI